ncbi:MarR family winged helix-turn-helix transcriptional regulator [Clostridium tarantellae]|uniref:MarR family transcriptional regulator n=1 Tax=Clostridium tarantellae TaxID=39493 RepID=A0A6I1MK44_9CLOT|nr:MarR family winged helix-turn-helix transcriptional regulator [Clostridium tarantellae]MPQ43896.1 MarR family transcriptional regulator [Clostridium tarantellae]
MQNSEGILNDLLVNLFNDILRIEENALKRSDVLLDLSVTEVHTLEAIGVKNARTMSEVALDLNITVGTLTTAIFKLIKKGYVERRRIEEDRRVVMIELTDKGKLAYDIHEKFHDEMIKETVCGLNKEEEKILISSLEKLKDFFERKYELMKLKEK